ncbi:MAG: glycosyltransferase family 2 protein [Pseudomonadota bacterium]
MTWGTVTLADEPSELLLAFAAWHVSLGASGVHIFLDTPHRVVAKALRKIPGVQVTQCDEMFWAANGGRAPMQTKRQDIVAQMAYAEAEVDWLAHIDADEFLTVDGAAMTELGAVPSGVVGLRIPVRERVWLEPPTTIFDGAFKVPVPGRLGLDRTLLGPLAKYTQRGLTGHTRGKTIVRTGSDLTLSIHGPKEPETLNLMEAQSLRLLHFDGLTPFHWLLKRLKYAAMPHAETKKRSDHYRWNQINALQEMDSPAEAHAFQEEVTVMGPESAQQLRALRLLEDAPGFDPAAALATFGMEDTILSVERFDKRLRRRDGAFIEAIGWDA